MKRPAVVKLLAAFVLFVSGCASLHSNESALTPAGPQADRMARLFWLFTGVGVFVWTTVVLFLVLALWRRRSRDATRLLAPPQHRERRIGLIVTGSVVLTVAILFVLLIGEFSTACAMHRFAANKDAVSIQITAQQWWWETTY